MHFIARKKFIWQHLHQENIWIFSLSLEPTKALETKNVEIKCIAWALYKTLVKLHQLMFSKFGIRRRMQIYMYKPELFWVRMCDILSIRLLSLYIFENSHIYVKSMCNPIIFVAQNNYRTLVLFKNRRA